MSRRWVVPFFVSSILLGSIATVQAGTITTPAPRSAPLVIRSFIRLLNAGMQSGDFAALASVYAPTATLTVSNPKGLTTLFHGLTQISTFYRNVARAEGHPHFTIDSMRSLSPTLIYSYEHAGHPGEAAPARCTHLYVLQDGKIMTDDFVVFFPGKA